MPKIKERHPLTLLERAIALAVEVHGGHRDGVGQPYLLHALRVMALVTTEDERVVAVLHDTVENGGDRITFERLRDEGYPERIIEAVECLTDRNGETYEQFVERIAPNSLARRVKLADLEDNLQPLRWRDLSDEDLLDQRKRIRAWHRLREITT